MAINRSAQRALLGAAVVLCVGVALGEQESLFRGERLGPELLRPGVVEPLSAAVERQRKIDQLAAEQPVTQERRGEWVIPAAGAALSPTSGRFYAINRHGATEMPIGFPAPVDVRGAYFVAQGAEALWAECLQVRGYRDGELVGVSEWLSYLDRDPAWLDINLQGVDRIVVHAPARLNNAAFFGMDDLTFVTQDGNERVVDFEGLNFKRSLTNLFYEGVVWEEGNLGFTTPTDIVPAPQKQDLERVGEPEPNVETSIEQAATDPVLGLTFRGVVRGDAGSFSSPPDTHGAIGPTQYVITVNRNFAVYDRTTGTQLQNVSLSAFLPGSSGDPRVLWDQYSGRWVVIVSDFNTTLYLAVSRTADATGDWFRTSFVASAGSDTGAFPDYPTLGVDENGIYVGAFMAPFGMTIFAIDKAPLIAATPTLGAVTAFRGFPFEGALQPVHTYGDIQGQFFVSTRDNTNLAIRRVNPPLTSPTLTDLGNVDIPTFSEPPDAPALGVGIPLDTVGSRLMNAMLINGVLYTSHCINIGGRAAIRWYAVNPQTRQLLQSGVISDPVRYYYFPAICANRNGDIVLGFSGSSPGEFASAYYAGRLVTDPPGETSTPTLYRAGQAGQSLIDGFGRNRYGDYSQTTLDPQNELVMWTIQEYIQSFDIWATFVAEIQPQPPALVVRLTSSVPELQAPGVALPVTASIEEQEDKLASAVIRYRFDDGPFLSAPLESAGGSSFAGSVPLALCGSTPEFFIEAQATGGEVLTDPFNAPDDVFSYGTGVITEVVNDNFETDLGWGVTNTALQTGPWERGVPSTGGDRFEPPSDFDGSGQCYITGNSANEDIDGGPTVLTSPVFDLSAPEEWFIDYVRWFWNNNADQDRLTVEISNNNGASWVLVEDVGGTQVWTERRIRVADFVTPTAQVRIRFSAVDNPNNSITEAGLDAVRVFSIACEDPAPCVGDFDGDRVRTISDVNALLGSIGSSTTDLPTDLDNDDDADLADVAIFQPLFGQPCP